MENNSLYAQLTNLMNDARAGKITVGKFTEKAEELYGVKLPELGTDTLSSMADACYSLKESGLPLLEYYKRVEEILNALTILDTEYVVEKFAESGRLTI